MLEPSRASRFLRGPVAWLACAAVLVAQPERLTPNWLATAARTTATLAEPGQDIIHLVRKLEGQRALTADDLLFKVSVFARAGMESEAIEALRELKQQEPTLRFWDDLLRSACTRSQFALAHAILELHGDAGSWGTINHPPALDRLVIEPLLAEGWTVERVDRWLSTLPRGQDDFIRLARLEFDLANGLATALPHQLVATIRTDPRDVHSAVVLLKALGAATTPAQVREKMPVDWLVGWMQPRLATESAKLGEVFAQSGHTSAALHFFGRAAEMSFTSEDAATFGPFQSVPGPSHESLRKGFVAGVYRQMAGCRAARHDPAEADRLGRMAVALEAEQILEWRPRFSSQAHNEGGAVPRSRAELEAQEASRGGDPDYWLTRAAFFNRLNDAPKAEEALKRGLAVTPPTPASAGRSIKGYSDARGALLMDYARFLDTANRADEGTALLWREFREAPAEAASREAALRLLLSAGRPLLSAGDELLWRRLSDHAVWTSTEESMMTQMLQSSSAEARPQTIRRAEALVRAAHPTRAYFLGRVLIGLRQPAAGVPLLEAVLVTTGDRTLARTVRTELFDHFLAAGDWKRAEALLAPFDPKELYDDPAVWFGRLALAAAKAGDRQDAIRLWQVVVRRNPQHFDELPTMGKLGLKNDLVAMYRALQRALPTSRIPDRAVKLLGASRGAKGSTS